MKPVDLVTLSAYALQSAPLWKWRDMVWIKKKPLVGLVVRVENNPWQEKKECSINEKIFYYVNWMQDGPGSRYGRTFHHTDGYFLRNDLKYVREGEFE